MVVPYDSQPAFTPGRPRLLFKERFEVGISNAGGVYDVAPDGNRFIVIRRGEETISRYIHWFTGWSAEVAAGFHEADR